MAKKSSYPSTKRRVSRLSLLILSLLLAGTIFVVVAFVSTIDKVENPPPEPTISSSSLSSEPEPATSSASDSSSQV